MPPRDAEVVALGPPVADAVSLVMGDVHSVAAIGPVGLAVRNAKLTRLYF